MRQREAEFAARLKKIQDKMNAMAETVVKDENEKRLNEERRILQLQMQKDMQDLKDEREKKQRLFETNINVNR